MYNVQKIFLECEKQMLKYSLRVKKKKKRKKFAGKTCMEIAEGSFENPLVTFFVVQR